MQIAPDHDAANIVETCESIEPFDRARLKRGQGLLDSRSQVAKFVARQLHQLIDCPERHRFLHRLTATNRGLLAEAHATEEADASARPQRSVGVPWHLHPSADDRRDKAGEGREWRV
jgi:hypothetical protein